MEPRKFRKLNIDLPMEPTVNERPWFIAGLVFAIGFLIFTAYAFLQHKGML